METFNYRPALCHLDPLFGTFGPEDATGIEGEGGGGGGGSAVAMGRCRVFVKHGKG